MKTSIFKNFGTYAKLIKSAISGDDDAVKEAKLKLCTNDSIDALLAEGKCTENNLKENLRLAEEKLAEAFTNKGEPFYGVDARKSWATSIIAASNTVVKAEHALEVHKEEMAFYEDARTFVNGGSKGL